MENMHEVKRNLLLNAMGQEIDKRMKETVGCLIDLDELKSSDVEPIGTWTVYKSANAGKTPVLAVIDQVRNRLNAIERLVI